MKKIKVRSILIRDCGRLFHKHLYELWKGKIMDSNTCGHRYIFGLRNSKGKDGA